MTPQELKNSILQLAIQGKLVEQCLEEGTAEELYRQIQVEKQSLIKAGKIKKEKPLSEISADEIPFDIPETWMWIRLGNLASVLGGKRIPAGRQLTQENTGHIYIRVSDMKNDGVDLERLMYVPEDIYPTISRYIINKEDLYITVAGTIGRVGMIPPELDGANLTENADRLVFQVIDKSWLLQCLKSSVVQTQIADATTKVGQPKLAIKRIQDMLIPLPPLSEQKRIVAKITELMPLIDQYEQAWSKLEDFNKRFPGDMQKSILQLAIQGKLVEQRPEEGTARQLLDTAVTENNVDGQRVKQKTITDITDEDIAFEIPDSWEWIKLGNTCTIARGGSPRPIKDFITTANDGVNWIKIGDTEKDGKYISSTAEKIKPAGVSKSRMVHAGDFLLTNSMSFGRPYILKIDGCIHDGWLVISQSAEIFDQDYLYWMLSSGYAYSQFCGKVSGAVVKNLNSDKVANSVFPLPPIAEQKRIVARLEELLPLCERLK